MITAITAAGAWLAAPGAAPAAPSLPSARELAGINCHSERSKLGKPGFRRRYGARPMRTCVRKQTKLARSAIADSANECNEELADLGPEDFAYSYSDLEDGSDAWENCVLDGLGLLDDSEVDAPAADG